MGPAATYAKIAEVDLSSLYTGYDENVDVGKIEYVVIHGVKKKVTIPTPAIMKCTAEISRRRRARGPLIAPKCFPEAHYAEKRIRIRQNLF